ncbi:hypothetical protein [Rhodoferax ferrireducens]|uniref:hypothetical protein n=1 Tax=Rhodoferax ferrireducens TaxID=192843 RepID=UPI000E0D13EF|nr:hypothetical protein [Rhodoferax ferrireducens]
MKVAFYKSTRPGIAGIYNRLVRWWTRSPYSHAELIFSDGWAASSSFADGGVRFKRIDFDPAHWDFVEIDGNEAAPRQWFHAHDGDLYDLWGNVGFVVGPVPDDPDKRSCAESIAAALGYAESWRYSPAILHSALSNLNHSAAFELLAIKGAA